MTWHFRRQTITYWMMSQAECLHRPTHYLCIHTYSFNTRNSSLLQISSSRHGKFYGAETSTPSIEATNERHYGNYYFSWLMEKGGIMRSTKIRAVLDLIERLAKMGVVDSDEHVTLRKAVNDLSHALSIRDNSRIEKAIDKIARLLMRA